MSAIPLLLLQTISFLGQVGSKVSAVSAKTNTTRAAIIGVSTHRSTQLVICDTPGLAGLAPGRALRNSNKQLVNRAQRAGLDCDAVIVVIDAAREIERWGLVFTFESGFVSVQSLARENPQELL